MFSMCVSLDSKNLEKSHDFHGGGQPSTGTGRHLSVGAAFSLWTSCCNLEVTLVVDRDGQWASRKESRWWFQKFLIFTPKIGEDAPILTDSYLSDGWFNHQLEMVSGLQERKGLIIDGFYTPVSNLRYLGWNMDPAPD